MWYTELVVNFSKSSYIETIVISDKTYRKGFFTSTCTLEGKDLENNLFQTFLSVLSHQRINSISKSAVLNGNPVLLLVNLEVILELNYT